MPRGVKGSAVCGTYSGYQAHRKRGEDACRPCKDAVNLYNRVNCQARKTFSVPIRCPKCGGATLEQNSRKVRSELVAIVKCATSKTCGYVFVVRIVIVPAHENEDFEPTKCGTEAGAQRHYRAGEQPCEACLLAHTQARVDGRSKSREKKRTAA